MTWRTQQREDRGCDSIRRAAADHTGWSIEPIARADEEITELRHVEDADTSAPVRRVSITSAEHRRAHAAFRARRNGIGIGAALVRSTSNQNEHVWECIVTDGREWHYIRVLGSGLGQFPDIPVEAIESGIECFAGTLPAQDRIYNLLNANPLHIDRNGNVSD
ncbi:MAG TPA: hypothetical protein VFH80_24090 [Solirubrobacteraceae bacterium]|nr:hypothetical protein [Solirubrobacteraceae bacterium]